MSTIVANIDTIMSAYKGTLLIEMVVIQMQDLGRKVKQLREGREWSQAELARRSGITKSAISTYEVGTRTPSADVVKTFAKVFGVSSDYLLGINERKSVEVEGLSERDEALIRELVASLKEKM